MNTTRISDLEKYDQFKREYKHFVLDEEYPGWTGNEVYGIITGKSEIELLRDYPSIMKALVPYIVLNLEYGQVRNDSLNSDRRHSRHKEKSESMFGADDELETHHVETAVPDISDPVINRIILEKAFSCLTVIQKSRVWKYFYLEMSYQQIAQSEGGNVDPKTVWESIHAALKKMKKSLS